MRFHRTIAFALLLTLFAPASLRAQLTPSGILDVWLKARESADAPASEKVTLYSKSKALVIGNDAYDGRSWPTLSNGVRDAEEIAKGLAAQGFEVTLKKNLKSDELDHELKNFFIYQGADQGSRLLIWFAGHGNTIDGEGYIVPVDAPSPQAEARFRDKAISLRRFGEYMREARARHVLAIFDSCFSGSVFNVARALPPPAITLATTQPVREFISSGDAEQQVSDDGTFRRLFLDVLAGKERDADANGDGYVTGTELGLFLHQKMSNFTNNRQTPRYGKLNALGYDRGDFVFQVGTPDAPSLSVPAAGSPPAPQPFSDAAQAWAVTQGTTSIAVLEAFVRQFADTPFGPMARARLEELKRSQTVSITPPPSQARPPQSASAQSSRQECDRLAAVPNAAEFGEGERGVELTLIDAGKAIAVCRQALESNPNDPRLLFELGRAQHADKNYAEAFRLYRQAADFGDSNGLNNMGLMFLRGQGVTKDYSEAERHFRKAADAGNPRGVINLGRLYIFGFGVAKNYDEAVRLFRKAADAGNATASGQLAYMYAFGFGVSKNYDEAARLYRRGSESGDSESMNGLGRMYEFGLGVARDYGEAVRLFRRAADLGNNNGITNLGWMYRNGRGVNKDYGEATRLFRKAADAGSGNGMNGLASMYAFGHGVAKDYGEAVRLYRKGVDLGNSAAMSGLARMYFEGWGVAKDLREAERLYRQSAELGNSIGMTGLGWMYQNGLGVERNYSEALRLNRQAAELGNSAASNNLGLMFMNGLGVGRDLGEAERLFRKAAELGDERAQGNLEALHGRRRTYRY
jgi:TPR repeat protein